MGRPAIVPVLTAHSRDRDFRTINLNVNFIRVGRAHPLAIEAVVVAQTRQATTVRAALKRDDGELVVLKPQPSKYSRRSTDGSGRS
jgi:acyl-coenzyme A thioesterase PaaI-like protein